MTTDWEKLGTGIAKNLLLTAALFLPLFLFLSAIEVRIDVRYEVEPAFNEPILHELSGLVVLYVSLILQSLFGSLVHCSALVLFPKQLLRGSGRLAAFALAPSLPLTVILSGMPNGEFFSHFGWATAAATIAYGLACSTIRTTHQKFDRT